MTGKKENMENAIMKQQAGAATKLSKITIVICTLAFLFTCISILITREMNTNAQKMYDHPYTVSNTARAMRSRLLDMKSFSNILITHAFDSDEDKAGFFQARYDMQYEAIDAIYGRYLGPMQDVDALRQAMDALVVHQTDACDYADGHTAEEVQAYMDEVVYPCYDAVGDCLDTIIEFADVRIRSLNEQVQHAGITSAIVALALAFSVISLTILSNRQERRNIEALTLREHELQDALLLAQQAGNAKKDFLSRMSHEIRTPMNVIVGMATIAGAYLDDKDRVKDCLSKIAFSSKHLLALINDVLDMSKIEEGKLAVNYEQFHLPELIEAIGPAMYSQAAGRGSTFECVQDVTSEDLIGDSMRVNQILLNLLSNAIKFTPAGGTIRLGIRQAPVRNGRTNLVFAVSDTGIGMSEEFMERLFNPFEQADGSISQKYGGTGLGMAITHNLVGLLGGSIHVKSKLGQGTTFTVELPFDVPESSAGSGVRQLENIRVLVVDDDESTCTHASLLLEKMGIDARWVQHGAEAIQILLKAHEAFSDYNVCLVDWQMPDMNGVEVTRRIREQLGPDTLIVIISAYDWSEIEHEARQAGANAFISKPLFESSLYHVLSTAILPKSPSEVQFPLSPVSFSGKHFLLVEDNELNKEIAVELLKVTGAEIDCSADGKAAVDRFNDSPFGYYDVILMDVQMPIMGGYEATKLIRASNRPDAQTVPIFAMTANAFREDEEAALASGMNGHIAKPIDVPLLYKILSETIKERQSLGGVSVS